MDTQPRTEPAGTADLKSIEPIVKEYAGRPGALLPLLHAIQDQLGFVPEGAVALIAPALNLSRAEVHGVITFYHLFRTTRPGKQTLFVCRAEACQAMGARQLEQYIKDKLKIDYHETTVDGRFSLEPVYCLGNCACSPAIMIDETVHGRVNSERLDQLLS